MEDEPETQEPEQSTEEEAPSNDGASSIPETPDPLYVAPEPVTVVSEALTEESAPVKLEGRVWEIVVIREGWSLNGRYYPRDVLKESLPLWEGQEVCAYGYDPHRERGHVGPDVERKFPQGTYLNKIGNLTNLREREVNGVYELVADFVCTKAETRSELLETYEATGKMPFFSIHADGDVMDGIREAKRGRIVTKITATKELTLVTKPAAGGRAYRLAAGFEQKEEGEMLKTLRDFISSRLSQSLAGLTEDASEATLLKVVTNHLKEMDGSAYAKKALGFIEAGEMDKAQLVLEMMLEMSGEAPSEPPAEAATEEPVEEPVEEAKEPISVVEGRALKQIRRMEMLECRANLREALSVAELPTVAEEQIKARFDGKVFKESELTEAIDNVKAILAATDGGGRALVESTGAARHPQFSVLVESADKFQPAMNLFFGYPWREDESLTEAEKDVYRSLEGSPQTRSIKRLYEEAANDPGCHKIGMRGTLTEAVSTTTFSQSLGTSVTLMLQHDFANMPTPDWQDFVKEVDGETLLQRDRVIQGGIGMLPTVAEGANYQDLGQPAEFKNDYSLEKRGGYIEITEEAILNDRIDFIRGLPNKLRNAALEAEKSLIYKALIGNLGGSGVNSDTSYDGVVHYSANHDNYSTTALSNAALVNAKLLTKRQMVFATATALNDATDINTSDTAVVVDDATGIRAGMYIRCEAEWMEVTGVASNTLTVVRGARGSTAASHVDDTPIYSYAGMLPWESNGGFAMSIIVPTELEDEAHVALASQYLPGSGNNDVNTLNRDYKEGRIKVVSVDSIYLGGDTNNWYTAVPYQVAPGLEFGYLSGSRIPRLINQTQDAVGQVFLADVMRFKVKHRIGANNLFHEGRTGHIVS